MDWDGVWWWWVFLRQSFKFDPSESIKPGRKGYPSFWSMAIEHLAYLREEQWAGQSDGFIHFIEVDFFEYATARSEGINTYIGNMHDWYGEWKKTCLKQFCKESIPYSKAKKTVPEGTDFKEFHRYGFLWVPATPTIKGWAQFYFDGEVIGEKVEWSYFKNQSPTMKREDWTFGILDRQHLVLILGTGVDQPMTIKSVKVWQRSSVNNLTF